MSVVTSTHLRQNLASVLDSVTRERAPVVVTRQSGEAIVMLPLEEFEAMEATLHLLRSPTNAERLLASIADAEAGRLFEAEPTA